MELRWMDKIYFDLFCTQPMIQNNPSWENLCANSMIGCKKQGRRAKEPSAVIFREASLVKAFLYTRLCVPKVVNRLLQARVVKLAQWLWPVGQNKSTGWPDGIKPISGLRLCSSKQATQPELGHAAWELQVGFGLMAASQLHPPPGPAHLPACPPPPRNALPLPAMSPHQPNLAGKGVSCHQLQPALQGRCRC